MSIPNQRDYGLPDDAVVVNIGGHIRDLRTVPTEEGGDWRPPSEEEEAAARAAVGPLDGTAPDAGTGAVWVSPVEGYWFAIWDHAEEGSPTIRSESGPEGMTREEAVAWAVSRPAARHVIYDEEGQDFVPLARPDTA